MTNPPESSANINTFVPPDILNGKCSFNDFARMFYDYRDVMDYNSRLFLIFVKKKRSKPTYINGHPYYVEDIYLPEPIERSLYLHGKISDYHTLVSVLLSTKNKDLIHLEKEFLDGDGRNTFFTRHFKDTYEKQVKDGVFIDDDRNFQIMRICVGHALYKAELYIKERERPRIPKINEPAIQEHLLDFVRKEELIDVIEYARQAFAYYNTELPKLQDFVNANMKLILTDVGDPKLLRLLEEYREEDKYHFFTRKEQILRLRLKRKKALEAELQRLNTEIKSLESEK